MSTLRDRRLELAMQHVAADGARYLRRMRGKAAPAPLPMRRAKTERVKILRPSGMWEGSKLVAYEGGPSPTGAEWFFARWCALECLHLWPAPDVVRQYLESGDPRQAQLDWREEQALFDGVKWAGVPRETAASAARSNGCRAARAAMYAATGAIDAAAREAVDALAAAAQAEARRADPSLSAGALLEAYAAARVRLRAIFKAKAAEIYRAERFA